ncbi:hypothetical protein MC7420_4622 [Coleofasciculus chthonoplastes PCC 7420]|uniref:Uncharacterized protein n=1 Tax=Coleofasciculus chthonoplastes PCC 7420 TaxID=118168 RepID=B4VNL2_9CYAN|nr:hypothetical protein [Coleofasciculus chthonoplastes]EDX76366.1 hypothetical protein MC7420_4622 [Coleofasciculus chthonoplastes PCC 7420]
MRLSIWNSYTPDTSLLLYPASSDFFQNSFSPYSRRRCLRPPCSIDPIRPIPRPGFLATFPSGELVFTSLNDNGNLNQGNEAEDKEANITDIMIPMSLYLPHLVEPTRFLSSKSHNTYFQHYLLYQFWRKHLVHLT